MSPSGSRVPAVIAGLDGLDGIDECLFQLSLADGPNDETEEPSLQVLAVADDRNVDVRRAVGLPCEVIGVAGRTAPQVRIRGREDDVVGIGPVVVQAFPDAARTLGDIGMRGASLMNLHVLVGAVAKELRAAGTEVREPGDVLIGRQRGRLMKMQRSHLSSLLR